MKYFFLSDGWIVGRVWGLDGLWQFAAWRRAPQIERMNICLVEKNEILWLYSVENAVLTVEVKPTQPANQNIGQVIIKRLITAEQVLERLGNAETSCAMQNSQAVLV
ncbi:MAG: hypothetical protein IGS39_11915 [Calothrix sp. C42_A2020_038]|nr:hypothetical protein [Calothrix sp. C42_A2020_038]